MVGVVQVLRVEAADVADGAVNGLDDLGGGDLGGRAGQPAPAPGPALGGDDAGLAELGEDGLDELAGQVRLHGHHLGGQRQVTGRSEHDTGAQGVVGSGGHLHGRSWWHARGHLMIS